MPKHASAKLGKRKGAPSSVASGSSRGSKKQRVSVSPASDEDDFPAASSSLQVNEEEELNSDGSDYGDEEGGASARYMGESEMESEVDEDEEDEESEEDELTQAKNELARMPLAMQARAQKLLKAQASNDGAADGEDGSGSDVDEEPSGRRDDGGRSGRTAPRHVTGITKVAGEKEERHWETDAERRERREKERERLKRSGRHAPMEMSSKKPVSRARQVIDLPGKTSRDPRFSSLSGNLDPTLFSQSYSFLATQRDSELRELSMAVSAARKDPRADPRETEKLEVALSRMRSVVEREKREAKEKEVVRGWKKEERDKRKDGKGEWHLKKSAKREMLVKARYEDLAKDKRKLSKAMDKKRRKESAKEKKRMPNIPAARE